MPLLVPLSSAGKLVVWLTKKKIAERFPRDVVSLLDRAIDTTVQGGHRGLADVLAKARDVQAELVTDPTFQRLVDHASRYPG